MRAKITDRLIAGLKPNEKEYEVWDSEIPGFCLIVRPTSKMSFCYKYRSIDGKKRKLTLGQYGKLTTTQARKLAIIRAGEVAAGIDVQEAKKRAKVEAIRAADRQTVTTLFELFANVELSSRRKDGGKAARADMDKHVLPFIGSLPIEDVGKIHIAKVLDPIVARGTLRAAQVVTSLLRQMFRFALDRDFIQQNPTTVFTKSKVGGKEVERDRVLSESEVRELAQKLPVALLRKYEVAVWLQLATCCRVGELLAARWDHVDLDAGTWHIPPPNSKNTKAHTIYLSVFALSHFKTLKTITGKETWCYPGKKEKGAFKITHPVDPKALTRYVNDRQLAEGRTPLSKRSPLSAALNLKGGKWTPHDLRRTGATMMTMLGVLPEVAERCLNHTEENRIKRTYQRYTYVNEMREAWQLLGERLELLTRSDADNVVPIRKSD